MGMTTKCATLSGDDWARCSSLIKAYDPRHGVKLAGVKPATAEDYKNFTTSKGGKSNSLGPVPGWLRWFQTVGKSTLSQALELLTNGTMVRWWQEDHKNDAKHSKNALAEEIPCPVFFKEVVQHYASQIFTKFDTFLYHVNALIIQVRVVVCRVCPSKN